VARTEVLQVVASSSSSSDESVFTLKLSTEDARKTILLNQYVREDGSGADVYCGGVGIDSDAAKQGLQPGMVLRSLSDPVKYGEIWTLSSNEKLRFVKDAINTTRQYEFSLTFDTTPTITLEMTQIEQFNKEEKVKEEAAERSAAKDGPFTAAGNPKQLISGTDKVDRPDLYSDQWDGDKYVGSGWNELTVGLAIAIAVPVLGLVFALATKGTLWGVVSFY